MFTRHEQVQRKLQARIEAQGKYLQAILDRAHNNVSIDINSSSSAGQLASFSLAISAISNDSENYKATTSNNNNSNTGSSAFQVYGHGGNQQENSNEVVMKMMKGEGGERGKVGLIQFDLN